MKFAFLFLCILPLTAFAGTFFDNHNDGWFWYQEFLEDKKKPSLMPIVSRNPTEAIMAFRKQVEDSLNRAILFPTPANLKHYAEHYFEVIRRGQRFTDAYKVMLLQNPEYDYGLKFPTNHLTQPIHARQQAAMTEHKIRQFCKQHGFFFFMASYCEYCHAFAPIVKQFVDKYQISLVPISLDGGSVPPFSKVMPDNGTAKALQVSRLPALFAVNPKNGSVIPIANGMMSLSELEENIVRLMEVLGE